MDNYQKSSQFMEITVQLPLASNESVVRIELMLALSTKLNVNICSHLNALYKAQD
jgi:hypothetical protein